MERLKIKTKDLTPEFKIDGVSIEPEFKNIEKFYGIPAALHTVDRKFGTHTYLDVVKAATKELNVLVDGNNTQLLDPKSVFIEDESFDQAIETIESSLKVQTERHKFGFQSEAKIEIPMMDSDNYLNDAFKRHWTITRKPEGGVALTSYIVRLACTNGMVLPEKDYTIVSRNAIPSMDSTLKLHATISLMSIQEYLKTLFTQDGEEIPCTFADMLDMHKCLSDIAESEVADELFPIDGVKMFYAAQGIDTEKLARKWLDKLPTGLTYYQTLQILTNGAKRMTTPSIENQVKVARFCAPKRMKNLKDTNLHWNGAPKWTSSQISSWMGDK